VRYQYEKGAASLLELIDAERTFRGIRLERFQDLGAYWTAVLRLKASVGEPVEVASSPTPSSRG
jgi:outer membrane protein TolC